MKKITLLLLFASGLVSAQVVNDLCEDALPISCGDLITGTTIGANNDEAIAPECQGNQAFAPGVWYVYDDTSGEGSLIQLSMCGLSTNYDSTITVYTGGCNGLICLASNDDACNSTISEVFFTSDGNTTFYILVEGFADASGNFEMQMNCIAGMPPPPNDMIANSIDVDEIGFPFTDPNVETAFATSENGSPTGCGFGSLYGVWYNFVAEFDGSASAEIISPAGVSAVLFYTAPNEMATENDLTLASGSSCALSAQSMIPTITGQAYYIFVANSGGATDIVIDMFENLVVNDLCEDALPVSCGDLIIGTTIDANNDEAIAPECQGNQAFAPGVWYVYDDTSGEASLISLSMCDLLVTYDSSISVYTGGCNGLICLSANDDACQSSVSEVFFTSDGNTTFYILVEGFADETGNFEMQMNCIAAMPAPPNDMIVNSIDVDEIAIPFTDPNVETAFATPENGTPNGCGFGSVYGVWYNFVAEADGTASAEIISPAGDSAVVFFTAPNEMATENNLTLAPGSSCELSAQDMISTIAGQAYYIFVANSGGATDIVIDGENILGIGDTVIEGFTFHPNPVNSIIELNSKDSIERLEIFNILGQKVIDMQVNAISLQMDLSELQTGTYIMKVLVNGKTGTYKVVKK